MPFGPTPPTTLALANASPASICTWLTTAKGGCINPGHTGCWNDLGCRQGQALEWKIHPRDCRWSSSLIKPCKNVKHWFIFLLFYFPLSKLAEWSQAVGSLHRVTVTESSLWDVKARFYKAYFCFPTVCPLLTFILERELEILMLRQMCQFSVNNLIFT